MDFFTQHIFNIFRNEKPLKKSVRKENLVQHKKRFQTGSPAAQEKVEVLENSETSRELEKTETKSVSKNISSPFATERNFIKFPFFDLSKKSKRDVLKVEDVIYSNGEHAKVSWKVSRNVEGEFPSSIARRIHKRVVEPIINKMERPIPQLICVGSLREVCRLIGLTDTNNRRVKKVLMDMAITAIESKGTFYLREKKQTFEGVFHFYDGVFFLGDVLPNGEKADSVYVLLGKLLQQNYNTNYTVPLDWEYHKNLKGEIASRMYELLSLDFFVALENNKTFVEKTYSKWCPYFPITPQDKLFKVKKQFKRAIQQLVDSKYLQQPPEFEPIIGKRSDWTIRFIIGEKAKAEYKQAIAKRIRTSNTLNTLSQARFQQLEFSKEKIKTRKKQPEKKKTTALKFTPGQQKYIDWLTEWEIANAKQLVLNSPHSPETLSFIQEDFKEKLQQNFPFKKSSNQWLYWAVSNSDYRPPEHLKKKRKAKAKAEIRKKQKTERVFQKEQHKKLKKAYDTYIDENIKEYKITHSEECEQLQQACLDYVFEKAPILREMLEDGKTTIDGPMIGNSVKNEFIKRLKEKLSLPEFKDWMKQAEYV